MLPNSSARFMIMAIALALAFAQASPAEYTVTDLQPSNAFMSEANAVNGAGQVVGYAMGQNDDGSYFSRPCVWADGQSTDLFAQYPEIQAGNALGINDQGQVIGYCYTDRLSAFMWQAGMVTMLDPLPGDIESAPIAINYAGQVIGYSMRPDEQDPYSTSYRSCLWQNGSVTDLSACGLEYIVAINDSGQIIGQTAASAACVWQNGAMTLLDSAGVMLASTPTAMNASGQVVGQAWTASSIQHAFVWLPQPAYGLPAGMSDIGAQLESRLNPSNTPGATVSSIAQFISDAGLVFGEATAVSHDESGAETRLTWLWAWENGAISDVIPIPAYMVESIVGAGSGIVAGSYMTADWESRLFSWSRQAGLETVPCIAGAGYARINGINDEGQVVGTCDAPVSISGYSYNMSHAFMAAKVVTSALPVSEATIVRHGRTCQVRVKIGNPGAAPVDNVTISSVSLGGASPLAALPLLMGAINPGASKQCTLQFKSIPAGASTLEIKGSCSLGNFSSTQQVTAP